MAARRSRPARWLSLAAAPLLAACAAAGGPLPREPVVQAFAPAEVEADTLRAADGSAIPLALWGPAEPAAVILALHGYGDHGQSTFAAAATHWAERGIATLAVDQRGFGRNASRGRWPGAEGLVADTVVLSAQVRVRYPCVPLIVVGHSMGGGIVLAAAAQGLQADGIVLAAPAIWGGKYLNPAYRIAAWTAAMLAPERRFTGKGIVRIQASDNIEVLRAMRDDPLYLGRPSSRELLGLVRVTDLAEAAAGRVDLPALLMLGAKDQIVPNDHVGEVFANLRGPKQTIAYPEGWHLLFRDLQAPNVWRDVAEWTLSRTAPACPAGAPPPPALRALLRAALPAGRTDLAEAG